MGRIKIYLQGLENYRFGEDFDSKLSYLLFDKINMIFHNSRFRNFYYYTFSKFNIENPLDLDENISYDGVVSVIISSVNDTFLRTLKIRVISPAPRKNTKNSLKINITAKHTRET